MHYLLFYEKAPDYAARQKPLEALHLAYVQTAVKRGELVLGGSLIEPSDGTAVLLFQADSPAVVEAFAKSDPYVTQGIVTKWRVRTWDTVVGKDAANPLPE
ncbi:MAG: YciI-like protein [Nitrospiraceae bacterium]